MVELNNQFPFIHFNGGSHEPEQAFPDALQEIEQFKTHIKQFKCPTCQKNGFNILTYERGRKQWEAVVWCSCGVRGVVNDSGFHFQRLSNPNPVVAETSRVKK